MRKMIRECLDLRNSYLYTEKVAPWMKHSVEESTASEVNTDHFEPFPATSHCFRMEDGVVHVYASEHDTVELFPVASATAFFTDMHHVLRIMSIGNVRSACYLRLRFLEETGNPWLRRVHPTVISTISEKSIHMCIILLA